MTATLDTVMPASHADTKLILVSEIFGPVVQGEGMDIGTPCLFVRTGGCDYRCRRCDTMYAVDPAHLDEWERLTADQIIDRVLSLAGESRPLVILSGGNPAMWPLGPVVRALSLRRFPVAIETQGSLAPPWLALVDRVTVSPKGPSMVPSIDLDALDRTLEVATKNFDPSRSGNVSLKFVVGDEADFAFARDVAGRYRGSVPVFVQPLNDLAPGDPGPDGMLDRYRWLAERVLSSGLPYRVLPQLHVMAWGSGRGV